MARIAFQGDSGRLDQHAQAVQMISFLAPPRRKPGLTQLGLQLAFWISTAIVLRVAFAPADGMAPYVPWDKARHFIAFYILTVLALPAFPRWWPLTIAVCLAFFGGVIELIQGTVMVNRDRDVWDWLADLAGIAAAMAPLALGHLRRALVAVLGRN
jgi:hypothetical protein